MSRHTYFPKTTPKRLEALRKAKKRGEAAEEWLKTNTLTKETQAEFNALMKKIDKENS